MHFGYLGMEDLLPEAVRHIRLNSCCSVSGYNMKPAIDDLFVFFRCLWQLLRRAHVDSALGIT